MKSNLNTINYMLSKGRRHFSLQTCESNNKKELFGFKEIDESSFGYNFGTYINGIPVVCVYCMESIEKVSDSQLIEGNLISSGHVFILYLYGCDNTSYIKRFKTKREAIEWYCSEDAILDTDDLLYYNS